MTIVGQLEVTSSDDTDFVVGETYTVTLDTTKSVVVSQYHKDETVPPAVAVAEVTEPVAEVTEPPTETPPS